jgi:hypothetical protein
MWRPSVLVIAAAAFVLVPVPAHSRTRDPWAGKRVITKYGTVPKVGDRVVDDGRRSLNQARGQDKAVFRAASLSPVSRPMLSDRW